MVFTAKEVKTLMMAKRCNSDIDALVEKFLYNAENHEKTVTDIRAKVREAHDAFRQNADTLGDDVKRILDDIDLATY